MSLPHDMHVTRDIHEALNVLVVDDDPAIVEMLGEIVSSTGHVPVAAVSAEEALGLLPLHSFQIALLDQNLPGMEGLVMGTYLRRVNPYMTIALVTGEEGRHLVRKTRELGIRFVSKPFRASEIADVLEAYVVAECDRRAKRIAREDPHFAPPVAEFADELGSCFAIPGVPERIEGRLEATIRRCLNDLRSVSRYTERDRVVALSGLLTARVLGVSLGRMPSGRTPWEEYDALMREHGRRAEFER